MFTGGEPFSEPEALQVMMDCIPEGHRVFINTTLPVSDLFPAERIIAFTERNKDKITCINISRHMVHYVEECNDELLGSLKVPVRINCVLFKNYPHDGMIAFANRFAKYGLPIQFRADYTITTPENLYEREGDQILADLMKNFEYLGLDGCRIRCGYHFNNHGQHIAYHRTLPYSTMTETIDGTTYDILYDVLVKQTGEPHSDWTGVPLDVEAYRHVKFEPYDSGQNIINALFRYRRVKMNGSSKPDSVRETVSDFSSYSMRLMAASSAERRILPLFTL